MARDRAPGLWFDTLDEDSHGNVAARPGLPGDTQVDVAVVGGGFTGLWTAYYLARADPALRIAVVEASVAGFGASGRNGGWCSALFPASRQKVAQRYGRAASVALHAQLADTVDEVGRVCGAEGIDAHYVKGGTVSLATRGEHVASLRAHVAHERAWGASVDDECWLPADEAAARVASTPCLGAAYTPHCARIHPARLVRGLARVVEAAGVAVYEGTRALAVEPGRVRTDRGTVRADVVVRALEGFTPSLAGHTRTVAPVYSLMIATEALPSAFWDEVGWSRGETVTDGRNLIIYAQRTADDRIALGGRGAPYHFGSAVHPGFDHDPTVFAALHATLLSLFPGVGEAAITHRWGGPLAVPRDWFASVGLDRQTGLAWGGGYVGDGVGTSNLAGRTLADLVLERDTDLVALPWVGHRSPRWEPEPLRWLGVNAGLRLAGLSDAAAARGGVAAHAASGLLSRLTGG